MADTSQVKEITAKLKDGIQALFESDRYANYLKTMSKFHNYSTNNTLLIHMQRPGATAVAGFRAWQTKFERNVKKGEKAIKIFAPTPFVIREEKEKLDPDTRQPVLDENGAPIIEVNEKRLARFKVASVFDVSQTDGKPLPTLAQDLSGNVEQYEAFMDALRAVSPLPIVAEALPDDTDGRCIFGDRIAIREGMSQIQTVSAAIHEMTHAKLHDRSLIVGDDDEPVARKDRRTEEVEAESISYAVCQHFGIETGDNSFGYVATWSKGKDLKELNASLDTIRRTSSELIDDIDGKFQELVKERDINLAIVEEQSAVVTDTAEPDLKPNQHIEEIDGVEFVFTTANVPPQKENTVTVEQSNYQKFAELFPQVVTREYSYLRLEADGGMEPLSLEWIGDDQLSVMHTYTLNGDLCYDPMIVFRIDNDNKTMTAIEFEQSLPPLYQTITENGDGISVDGNGNQKTIKGLERSINEFTSKWFDNISEQGYMPVRGNKVIGEDEEVRIEFDKDGNPIMPEQEKPQTTELDMSLPDPTLSAAELSDFGYEYDGMLPLSNLRAIELFDTGHPIYLLYSDNTEAMAVDRDELRFHDGLCGIERDDWERSPVRARQLALAANSEAAKESELLHDDGNRFGIYQLKDGTETRNHRFASMKELESANLNVVRGNYTLIYTAPFSTEINRPGEVYRVLDKIFEDFNLNHPEDFTGHSLSVSDVIVLKYGNNISSHYIDSTGFEPLAGFLGDERQEAFFTKPVIEKMTNDVKNKTYSQVGNSSDRTDVPKGKLTIAQKLEQGKQRIAENDAQKSEQKNNMKKREDLS